MNLARLLPILLITLIIACKPQSKDPNQQVDEGTVTGETYTSKEIGWTIEIPKGFTVTSKDKVDAQEKKGQEMIEKSINAKVNVDELKNLISFGKNQFNSFSSTSQPFRESYKGEYEENVRGISALLHQTFTAQGIQADTATGTENIQGMDFHTVYTTVYSREGQVILKQNIYTRLVKGYDFNMVVTYNNESDRDAMIDALKKSKFQ